MITAFRVFFLILLALALFKGHNASNNQESVLSITMGSDIPEKILTNLVIAYPSLEPVLIAYENLVLGYIKIYLKNRKTPAGQTGSDLSETELDAVIELVFRNFEKIYLYYFKNNYDCTKISDPYIYLHRIMPVLIQGICTTDVIEQDFVVTKKCFSPLVYQSLESSYCEQAQMFINAFGLHRNFIKLFRGGYTMSMLMNTILMPTVSKIVKYLKKVVPSHICLAYHLLPVTAPDIIEFFVLKNDKKWRSLNNHEVLLILSSAMERRKILSSSDKPNPLKNYNIEELTSSNSLISFLTYTSDRFAHRIFEYLMKELSSCEDIFLLFDQIALYIIKKHMHRLATSDGLSDLILDLVSFDYGDGKNFRLLYFQQTVQAINVKLGTALELKNFCGHFFLYFITRNPWAPPSIIFTDIPENILKELRNIKTDCEQYSRIYPFLLNVSNPTLDIIDTTEFPDEDQMKPKMITYLEHAKLALKNKIDEKERSIINYETRIALLTRVRQRERLGLEAINLLNSLQWEQPCF